MRKAWELNSGDHVSQFDDRHWRSRDGLKLHFRDYAGTGNHPGRPPLVCLHGLTRNARDFADLAARLAGEWRVLVPEMRGRGDSGYAKDPETYSPVKYVDDVNLLLEQEGIDKFISIGTSMGGLMTILMGFTQPDRIVASVFNDVGPDLELEGIGKILDYVGQGRNFPTWMHAARALEETHGAVFPLWTIDDWIAAAKRVMVLSANDRIVFDYDMKIAEPFEKLDFANQPDLWPGYEALAKKPVLVLRGALSTLFSEKTFARMGAASPTVECVTVANVGHAPMLDEPEAIAGIERLLARVA